jgi:hypothetical protein
MLCPFGEENGVVELELQQPIDLKVRLPITANFSEVMKLECKIPLILVISKKMAKNICFGEVFVESTALNFPMTDYP